MSTLLLTDTEIDRALEQLPEGHRVSLSLGPGHQRAGWFRGQVRQHDPEQDRLVLTCYLDGAAAAGAVQSGMQMLVCTQRHDGQFYAAPMRVIEAGAGDEPAIALRQVGPWGRDVERRHEVRVRVSLPVAEARVRGDGGWLDVDARVRDLSASGLGLSLDRPVAPGDRVTVALDLPDGKGVRVRARLVVRHATQVPLHGRWLAGGDFQTIAAEDQERLLRFVFACLRARARPAA